MRKPLLTLAMLLSVMSAQSETARFYLGAYTKEPTGGKGIYTGTLDSKTGKLGPISLAATAENPSFVSVSPDGKYAYAALEGKSGAVGAYAVQPDGSLKFLNSQPASGKATCHVSVDAGGKYVFAANYSSGDIVVFPVQADGSLGAQTDFKAFAGSGPDAGRQKGPHAHFIQADPLGRFVYACDLGTDKVWIFALDAAKGTLKPADPDSASVPPGSGPRHLAFDPKGKFAYANNEMGLSVTTFSHDEKTGALVPLQTVPSLPAGSDHAAKVTTSEIVCHPSGNWLYVSNRVANTIATYSIGPDGLLTFIEDAPALVQVPRGMALDPTGHWLITAGQNNGRIAVLKVNSKTGRLSVTDEAAEVPSPVSVTFAP
ncbi:lactonase family protein [soil metagenome]